MDESADHREGAQTSSGSDYLIANGGDEGWIERVFKCAACDREAGRILFVPAGVLHPRQDELVYGDLNVETPRLFVKGPVSDCEYAIGRLEQKATMDLEHACAAIRRALLAGDVTALRRLDYEYTSFYCFECSNPYCSDHWVLDVVMADDFPGFYDCTYGICPSGHFKKIDD